MTIGKKLYIGFGVLVLLVLITGGGAIYNNGVLGDCLTNISDVAARNLYLAGEVDVLSTEMLSDVRAMNLRAHMNATDDVDGFYEKAVAASSNLSANGVEFVHRTTVPQVREKLQKEILDTQPQLLLLLAEDRDDLKKGNVAAADLLQRDKLMPLAIKVSGAGDDLMNTEYGLVKGRSAEAMAKIAPARNVSLVMILLALGVGGGVIWVVRKIVESLQVSILELGDSAGQVASAASQVSSSSQSLAQGASEQAASLEETSASSEEINSMARRNTDNSKVTAELLSQSQEKVKQANRHLKEMIVSMDLITDSSGKISRIIKVIDEIAFQTNILALNAAVEAARAGEAGMGFAVVADEVRSLAQRSAQAAKDTATLIEDSISRSNEGKVKVDQVALAIDAVTQDSAKVKVMVDEVSLGSEEQSRGIDQIGRAISQMERVTQTNAANAEESAAAAQELSAQSEMLKDVVSRLKLMVGGAPDAAATLGLGARSSSTQRSLPRIGMHKPSKLQANGTYPKNRMHLNDTTTAAGSAEGVFPMEENFQSF